MKDKSLHLIFALCMCDLFISAYSKSLDTFYVFLSPSPTRFEPRPAEFPADPTLSAFVAIIWGAYKPLEIQK